MPAQAGIQYAALYRSGNASYWVLDHPLSV